MVHKSDSRLQESLSALMDGEASELELHRLLKAMETDGELRQCWLNYHLASGAVRGELHPHPLVDLSVSISAAIAEEPVHGARRQGLGRLWRATGKVAVAASVAAAVLVVTQQFQPLPETQMAKTASAGSAAGVVPSGFAAPDLSARTVNVSSGPAYAPGVADRPVVVYVPDAQEQQARKQLIEDHLNMLMLEHADNAARNGSQGLMPYARLSPKAGLAEQSELAERPVGNDTQKQIQEQIQTQQEAVESAH